MTLKEKKLSKYIFNYNMYVNTSSEPSGQSSAPSQKYCSGIQVPSPHPDSPGTSQPASSNKGLGIFSSNKYKCILKTYSDAYELISISKPV